MNTPYVFKKCSKCGEWLVACKVNFHKNKGRKYGLESKCKKCKAEYHKQYRENNRDKIAERNKQYYKDNKDKMAEYHKQYRENNRDKIVERNKQYYKDNKDKITEKNKQYYKDNKDKVLERHKQWRENNKEYRKQWYKNNKDKVLEYDKQYCENNRDKVAEYQKQWRENNKEYRKQYNKEYCKQYYEENKDKIAEKNKQYYNTPQGQVSAFNRSCRRRIREQNQGKGITKEQWLEMMQYFDWKCAYSDEYIGGEGEHRTIDHVKPLSKGGEHEIWNLVPMYRPYNSSKHDKDLLEWYKEQDFYSEERLQKIYEWQEYAYKKWGNKDKVI